MAVAKARGGSRDAGQQRRQLLEHEARIRHALAADDALDPGGALVVAVAGGLVIGVHAPSHRSAR